MKPASNVLAVTLVLRGSRYDLLVHFIVVFTLNAANIHKHTTYSRFITTREAAAVVISVVSICLSVCL